MFGEFLSEGVSLMHGGVLAMVVKAAGPSLSELGLERRPPFSRTIMVLSKSFWKEARVGSNVATSVASGVGGDVERPSGRAENFFLSSRPGV